MHAAAAVLRASAVLGLALAAGACRSPEPAPEGPATSPEMLPGAAGLRWLSGAWECDQGVRVVEEHWTAPRDGSLLGANRTVAEGRTVAFEFLRIQEGPDGVVLYAAPGGRSPATPFRLVRQGPAEAVFENPQHDFPQRILYWLGEGGALHSRIEGLDAAAGGVDWRYVPLAEPRD